MIIGWEGGETYRTYVRYDTYLYSDRTCRVRYHVVRATRRVGARHSKGQERFVAAERPRFWLLPRRGKGTNAHVGEVLSMVRDIYRHDSRMRWSDMHGAGQLSYQIQPNSLPR
jgi:hypothetical protein